MNRPPTLLMISAIVLLVTGIGLAVAQPGSLGGDDDASTPTSPSTTIDGATDGDGGVAAGPTSTVADTTPTTAPTASTTPTTALTTATTGAITTPTTAGSGSGVGSDGSGSGGGSSDLADTGGRSLILAGLAVGGLGLALRRRSLHTI